MKEKVTTTLTKTSDWFHLEIDRSTDFLNKTVYVVSLSTSLFVNPRQYKHRQQNNNIDFKVASAQKIGLKSTYLKI